MAQVGHRRGISAKFAELVILGRRVYPLLKPDAASVARLLSRPADAAYLLWLWQGELLHRIAGGETPLLRELWWDHAVIVRHEFWAGNMTGEWFVLNRLPLDDQEHDEAERLEYVRGLASGFFTDTTLLIERYADALAIDLPALRSMRRLGDARSDIAAAVRDDVERLVARVAVEAEKAGLNRIEAFEVPETRAADRPPLPPGDTKRWNEFLAEVERLWPPLTGGGEYSDPVEKQHAYSLVFDRSRQWLADRLKEVRLVIPVEGNNRLVRLHLPSLTPEQRTRLDGLVLDRSKKADRRAARRRNARTNPQKAPKGSTSM